MRGLRLISLLLVLAVSPALAASPADMFALLRNQAARCWNPPLGAAGNVTVNVELGRDGRIVGHPTTSGLANPGVIQAAVRAVNLCQPYRLPPERFSDWQHAAIRFEARSR